jgi:hypothetical protein
MQAHRRSQNLPTKGRPGTARLHTDCIENVNHELERNKHRTSETPA